MFSNVRNYVGGAWCAPSGETFVVTEAATGQKLAEIPLAGPDQAVAACQTAREAFVGWSALRPAERATYLGAIADYLENHSAEIATMISREVGMPLKLSGRIQVAAPIMAWRRYAAMGEQLVLSERVGHSLVERVPAGAAVCITPWNYPLHQITAKVAPALLAGCTVVLKPSEIAPLSAYALAEACDAVGLPKGVFNLVVGLGPVVGEALVSHPQVDVISFTGSTATGRRIGELAARSIKRVSLELGGKSAAVVLPGADLVMGVKATVGSCFLNSGQTCSALTRLLVPDERLDEAAALAANAASRMTLGDPLYPATRLGPLASKAQMLRVRQFIETGIGEGAKLVCGGAQPPERLENGYFVPATVFSGVTPDMAIAREEIFGPVLSIMPYRDIGEAAAIANSTAYGLAASVWASSDEEAATFARRLRVGQVDINGAPFNLDAPFGGFGWSGIGRENGRYGLDEFLEYRSIQMPVLKAS